MPSPGSTQAWPNSAACWSPAMPASCGSWPCKAEIAPELARAGDDPRERSLGDPEQLEQLAVPVAGVEVEQHRAAGVRRIGDRLAGELVRQPRIDRAEHRPAVPGAFAEPVDVRQQPLDLGGAEVRIEHQAGALADERLVALLAQLGAPGGGAPVLPDDRAVQRLAGLGIPDEHRLPLAGETDGLQIARAQAGIVDRLAGDRVGHLPDLLRVVLDPARAGEVLGELAVAAPDRLAVGVEDEAGRAGRALVDREDHAGSLCRLRPLGAPARRPPAAGVRSRRARR